MTDREKVMKGLEICTKSMCSCDGCPYLNDTGITCDAMTDLMRDALDLIKSLQEDIEVWKKRYKWIAIERKTAGDPNKESNIVKVFTTEEMEEFRRKAEWEGVEND